MKAFENRFFFLSNDELLEILSETKDPLNVEPHMKKLFEGIRKLSFTEDKAINGIVSNEGEKVSLITEIVPQEVRGLVEKWLSLVEDNMRLSLRAEASKAIGNFSKMSRFEWISSFPGQIVIAVDIIFWTSQVTKVFF